MKHATKIIMLAGALFFLSVSQAHNKVVVIPMAGDDLKPLKNVISVAQQNGDFTNLADALDSISDADKDNPYLVVMAPGFYDSEATIFMKSYVNVAGSGEGTTILAGAIVDATPERPVIRLARNSTLSHLTVRHFSGTGSGIAAISAIDLGDEAYSSRLLHITARVGGGATGASMGIYMDASSITMEHVTARAEGANNTSSNYGIRVIHSSPIMRNISSFACFGAVTNRALYISNNTSSPVVIGATLEACGIESMGIYLEMGSQLSLSHSSVSGKSSAMKTLGETGATVTNSAIVGGTIGVISNFTCAFTHEDGIPLDKNCQGGGGGA